MDCKFRVLTKDKETFKKLKNFASGWSEKKLVIIEAKCNFLEVLKKFNIEMLMTPFRSGKGYIDCFYYDGKIKDCNKEILERFNMQKYEPIEWKKIEEDNKGIYD